MNYHHFVHQHFGLILRPNRYSHPKRWMYNFSQIHSSKKNHHSARWQHSQTKNSQDVIEKLESRQLIAQLTSRAVRQHLIDQSRTIYLGIDPTASSLHVGNLLALIALVHFSLNGHKTIVLLGGGTGIVGDPSGRSSERTSLPRSLVDSNVECLHIQVNKILDSALKHAQTRIHQTRPHQDCKPSQIWPHSVKNNMEWLSSLTLLDFLGSTGKVARIASMLARDSVKQRMDSGAGISFTEFTYQLLQAYDFNQLRLRYDCTIQLGGSDQYGNIMSGIEIMTKIGTHPKENDSSSPPKISETTLPQSYGVTIPLLLNHKGEKFGKSAGNALWLSSRLTPPVDLYQAFLRTPDSEIDKYLRMLTFLPLEEINRVMGDHGKGDRQRREPQKLLAREIILLVHGPEGLSQAIMATEILYPDKANLSILTTNQLQTAFAGSPHHIRLQSSKVLGCSIDSIAVLSGLCKSKGEARSLRQSGAITVNHQPPRDNVIEESDLLAGAFILLMRGKTAYKLVSILSSDQDK
ncbi:hypothetical protein DFH28DRAFT_968738 [Melampsora americana]|nr:hypothetical protein DFH28DRAFT_968738 [Melampsora americana]